MNTYDDAFTEDYFTYHPDAVTLTTASGDTVKGLFDLSFKQGEKDDGDTYTTESG